MVMKDCPLCNLEKNLIIYKDDIVTVCETKNKKGHKRRIMVVYNKHSDKVPGWVEDWAIRVLEKIGKEVFNYTYKFVILSPRFGSVPQHWHLVATDLDPNCEDFEQILGTPWLKVVDVRYFKKK